MTTNDEWLRERAWAVVTRHDGGMHDQHVRALVEAIAAFGQEAIERGKAEQDKAVAAERERGRYAVEEAVVWERLRGYEDNLHAIKLGEAKVIARLENPDEAMVEAVVAEIGAWTVQPPYTVVPLICRALALTLTEDTPQ